jgi:hypothetical protein
VYSAGVLKITYLAALRPHDAPTIFLASAITCLEAHPAEERFVLLATGLPRRSPDHSRSVW